MRRAAKPWATPRCNGAEVATGQPATNAARKLRSHGGFLPHPYVYACMSSRNDGTVLDRLVHTERQRSGIDTDDTDDAATVVPTGGSSKTHVDGEPIDLAAPRTSITFEDPQGVLSGEYGRPRPMDFFHAQRVGQTAPLQVIKATVTQQLTGGNVRAVADDGDDLPPAVRDVADVTESIYAGPHFQRKMWDDLVNDAVKDFIDAAWAYWERLPTEDGSLSTAAFKPLPPLQVLHNIDDSTGQLLDDPAYYHAPMKASPGHIRVTGDPTPLEDGDVVAMRAPDTSESNRLYGQSVATKVREWLELITDVDVHQKRHYADSHLPAGFLHFQGSVGKDKLAEIEQDIREVAGDPQELVSVSTEESATWIPVGGDVADLDAISQQQWYWKLVLAACGLNQSQINLVESSGFAKESPELQRMVFKNVTKPFMSAILSPQNRDVLPDLFEDFGLADHPFRLELERFDPVQEQVERDQRMEEWSLGARSLNEVRGSLGADAVEVPVEIAGTEVDLASTPKYVVDQLVSLESPGVTVEGDGAEASHSPLGEDEPLGVVGAAQALGIEDPHGTKRRLDRNTKQIEGTIDLVSSFLVSTAYDRTAPLMQLEFERDDEPNWVYWYADVSEQRFFRFLQSDSKGRYFNRHIRGEFPYARVT